MFQTRGQWGCVTLPGLKDVISDGVCRVYCVYSRQWTRSQSKAKTDYIYDGLALLSVKKTTGTQAENLTYLYGDSPTPVGGLYTPAGAATPLAFEIVSDMHGDVRELRDSAGNAFARFSYDAYGNIRSEQTFATALISASLAVQITAAQPLRYAGYVWDAETGLYYCSARYYDPSVAAFISKDPIKAGGEKSAYGYCAGDPVNGVDPSGLMSWADVQRADREAYQLSQGRPIIPAAAQQEANRLGEGLYASHTAHTLSVSKAGSSGPYYCAICGRYFDIYGQVACGEIPAGLVDPDPDLNKHLSEAKLCFAGGCLCLGGYFLLPYVAQRASEVASQVEPVFGSSTKSAEYLADQMATRGWTESSVTELVNNAYQVGDTINRATQTPATAYFAKDGSYVVIDNATKAVVQVSKIGDPNWAVDSGITNIRLVK